MCHFDSHFRGIDTAHFATHIDPRRIAPLIRRKLTRREEWALLLACIALLPLAALVLVARVRR